MQPYGIFRIDEELDRTHRHRENLDRVSNTLAKGPDIDSMLWNVLHEMLDILGVDRVWLLYPCDPHAPAFEVPLEVVREGHPGAFAQGINTQQSGNGRRND